MTEIRMPVVTAAIEVCVTEDHLIIRRPKAGSSWHININLPVKPQEFAARVWMAVQEISKHDNEKEAR